MHDKDKDRGQRGATVEQKGVKETGSGERGGDRE